MSEEQNGNVNAKPELIESLRSVILGEIRLAKRAHEEILAICREAYIEEECSESECDKYIQFTRDEINRAAALVETEKSDWPEVTDCDRLDLVETALRKRGIVLWQVSPCCDTCTGAELADRIDVIDERFPGFRERLRGYAFFIDQNMPEMLAQSTQTFVYLGYGWCSQDGSDVAPDIYESNAVGIGHEVCSCLRDGGFEPIWDGNFARKIELAIEWRRRTRLQ